MTEEKRVPIPERWQEDYVGLIELSNSLPEYDCMQTDIATQKKLIEQLGTAEAERDQLKAELAEMQWKPITPDSLPKVGDEVLFKWRVCTGKGAARWNVRSVCAKRDMKRIGIDHWRLYSHYRAINPPKP